MLNRKRHLPPRLQSPPIVFYGCLLKENVQVRQHTVHQLMEGGLHVKPLIGVAMDRMVDRDSWMARGLPDQEMAVGVLSVFEAISAAEGIPVGITESTDPDYVKEIINYLHGVCIPSGPDVFPGSYGQLITRYTGTVRPEKDAFDITLAKEAISKRKPLLGICRGMQIVNVVLGGDLVQDIATFVPNALTHNPGQVPPWLAVHPVDLIKDSFLYNCLQQNYIAVNSFHHQSIGKVGDGLRVVARTKDGIIEAVEASDPLILGIQWHPELMWKRYPEFMHIFSLFVKACKG